VNCLQFYYDQARAPEGAVLDYLLTRGVSSPEVEKYGIRFFSEKPETKHIAQADWVDFSKWSSDGNLLIGKMIFPLYNSQKQLIGIYLQETKLKGLKTKFLLKLSDLEGIFYNLDNALEEIWKTEEVFITEGAFDLYPLARFRTNSLGILTANISSKQISFFRRYVKRIFSLLDIDKAGETGFVKLKEKIGSNIEVFQLRYLAKDLNELWQKFGEDFFRKTFEEQLSRLILI